MTVIPTLERELIDAARREHARLAGHAYPDPSGSPTVRSTSLLSRARNFVKPHKRLTIVVVALVASGCAAVAATTLSSSTERLALGRVNCYDGTYLSKPWSKPSDVIGMDSTLVNGESPQAWCRKDFASYTTNELRSLGVKPVKNRKLVACRKNSTTIAVLIASGKPNQCAHLGLAPLPAAYAAASTKVHSLGSALRALYFSRNCWAPRPFAAAVHKALTQHGLGSWRVIVPPPPHRNRVYNPPAGTYGRCAAFVYPNPYLGNPYQSIDGPTKSFSFELAMSRSDAVRWNRMLDQLTAKTWRTCYKASAARALVDREFAGTGLRVRLALTGPNSRNFHFATNAQLPRNSKLKLPPQLSREDAQKNRHYNAGCVIQPMIWIAANDRFADVWLTVHGGRRLKPGTYPPPDSYFK
jgi:hypothetical protein